MKFLPLFLTTVAVFTASVPVSRADLIPADRLTDWTPGVTVGVPGGIPTNRTNLIDVTAAPYLADKTGVNDARAAIQAAINAANANDVVYLPAGKYRIDGALSIGAQKSNITLRGAGTSTVLDCRTSDYGIAVGTAYSFTWPPTGQALQPSTLTKGATQLTVADTSQFSVGQLVMIDLGNDPGIPVMSVIGYDLRPTEKEFQGLRRQITRVTAKTATTMTIFPGLYGDYTGAPAAAVFTSQIHTTGVGIEDLMIDCSNGSTTFPVGFNTCYGCWAKNVKVQYSTNYGIYISESLNCEIRHCWVDQAKGQGSTSHCGFLVDTGVGCLIEDNVIAHNFPSMMINHGSCGNVIAYNFCYDSTANGAAGASIDTNHGPHNSFNLYEGNAAPNVQADGYFGGASHDTIFRNWLHGMEPNLNAPGWTVSLNRFTRYYSLVGNILGNATWPTEGVSLGNPNMGNGAHTGEGPPWSVTWVNGAGTISQSGTTVTSSVPMFNASHVGWFLLTPSTSSYAMIDSYIDPQHVTIQSSRTLSNASYIVAPGSVGFQELDLGVQNTLLRIGNFNYGAGTIPTAEALGTATLPSSLYLKSTPSWFGSLSFPAFNPVSPNPAYESIPAGYRFTHNGTDAPGVTSTSGTSSGSGTTSGSGSTSGGATATTQSPMNVRVRTQSQ